MNEYSETESSAIEEIERICVLVEGALLAAGQPLNLNQLNALFDEDAQPGPGRLREALALLDGQLSGRAVELIEVAGGYRLQVREALVPPISRLWQEKPPRYSRALLETLAIIAYRQPITRAEIEQIRGVSLSTTILKTLQERDWIRTVGHRDLPGKPELLGTTSDFLDYFGLKGLDDLPTLAEIRDLDNPAPELALNDPDAPRTEAPDTENEAQPEPSDESAQDPQEEVDASGRDDETTTDEAQDADDEQPETVDSEETGTETPPEHAQNPSS